MGIGWMPVKKWGCRTGWDKISLAVKLQENIGDPKGDSEVGVRFQRSPKLKKERWEFVPFID